MGATTSMVTTAPPGICQTEHAQPDRQLGQHGGLERAQVAATRLTRGRRDLCKSGSYVNPTVLRL